MAFFEKKCIFLSLFTLTDFCCQFKAVILEENGRGLIGEVTPDYLCLFNPKMH